MAQSRQPRRPSAPVFSEQTRELSAELKGRRGRSVSVVLESSESRSARSFPFDVHREHRNFIANATATVHSRRQRSSLRAAVDTPDCTRRYRMTESIIDVARGIATKRRRKRGWHGEAGEESSESLRRVNKKNKIKIV